MCILHHLATQFQALQHLVSMLLTLTAGRTGLRYQQCRCLPSRAKTNYFALFYGTKDGASFHSDGRQDLDLVFDIVDLDSRLPDRCISRSFQMTTPTLTYYSTQDCTTQTKQARQPTKLPQHQLNPIF